MRRSTRSGRLTTTVAVGALTLAFLAACGDDDAPLFPESQGGTTTAGASGATSAGSSAPAPATTTGAAPAATTAAAAPTTPVGSPEAGSIVTTVSSPLGVIVADREGRTLYVFDNDDGHPASTCLDQCATNWPPARASGAPIAAGAVDTSLLGTTPRGDGTLQVTYAGRPLYYFGGDQAAGDTLGQGVGGLWHVVDAKGQKVTGGATGPAAT
jgi:predicted lipoprotein with Yx(FWY)xxD motif